MAIRKKKPAALAIADITCPTCGSKNSVRVAGVYEHPRTPANWYCRCYSCNKGFNPRPKESYENPGGGGMGRPTVDLSKEELLEMIQQGMSAEEIADAKGLSMTTVVRYKKNYGLNGLAKRGRKKRGENDMDGTMLVAQVKGEGEIQVEQPAEGRTLTIAAALKHRSKMTLEAESIKVLIEHTQGLELAPGVLALLKGYQEGCNTALERVNRAFETVEIAI